MGTTELETSDSGINKSKTSESGPSLWGPPVWLLFHMIGEKIDEDYLINNKEEIIILIKIICNNIPCPYSKNHAIEVLKLYDFNFMKCKNDLKKFFWTFHNIVNKRINKEYISIEYLEKYKTAIPYAIIQNFKIKFLNRSFNEKLMIDNILSNLNPFLLQNPYKFYNRKGFKLIL